MAVIKRYIDKINWQMKHFSLKRKLDEDVFENELEKFFLPVNDGVDEVASALSESLISKQNGKISNPTRIAYT